MIGVCVGTKRDEGTGIGNAQYGEDERRAMYKGLVDAIRTGERRKVHDWCQAVSEHFPDLEDCLPLLYVVLAAVLLLCPVREDSWLGLLRGYLRD